MTPAERRSSYIHRFHPLIALILFAVALWVLYDALRQVHYHHSLAQLKAIPAPTYIFLFSTARKRNSMQTNDGMTPEAKL